MGKYQGSQPEFNPFSYTESRSHMMAKSDAHGVTESTVGVTGSWCKGAGMVAYMHAGKSYTPYLYPATFGRHPQLS